MINKLAKSITWAIKHGISQGDDHVAWCSPLMDDVASFGDFSKSPLLIVGTKEKIILLENLVVKLFVSGCLNFNCSDEHSSMGGFVAIVGVDNVANPAKSSNDHRLNPLFDLESLVL